MRASETPPPVPDGVLVQSLSIDEEGVEAGYRIYRDGRYESRPRGSEWADGAPLDAERLAAVERAIEATPVDELAGRYESAAPHGDPPLLWLQFPRGDGVRSICVVGGRRVPELERLTARLTDVFRADP